MRKLTSMLLATVLLLSCTVTAFAAEDDPVEIGVYAKTECSIEGEYTAPIENGSASVTTPDGTVAVTNAPAGAVTLVVIPMEGEALTWVDGCVDADTVAAYDIHFRDAEGNEIATAKVEMTAGECTVVRTVPVGAVSVRVGIYAWEGNAAGDFVTVERIELYQGAFTPSTLPTVVDQQ